MRLIGRKPWRAWENGPQGGIAFHEAGDRAIAGEAMMARHILVVEDDESYSRLVKRMLESAGFHVTLARDFVAALHVIEGTEAVDLLLADINMPPGSPHGLSIGLMAASKRHDLKIVYMSGSVDPAQVARFAPQAKLLRKPFAMQELMEVIGATLAAS
jgi:CheY-like chemotaxis protein